MSAIMDNLPFMLVGLKFTLGLSVITIACSFIIGTALASGRLSTKPYLHYPAVLYIELVRSIPLILFILYAYFILADAGVNVSPFWAAAAAMSIFASSYIAEVVRAGISGVDPGQVEAARASGMSHLSTLRIIVLPQAFRSMAPALVSEFIKLVKDSSLASVIGVYEFFNRVSLVNARLVTASFVLLGFAAVVYFLLNYGLSLASKRLELRADV